MAKRFASESTFTTAYGASVNLGSENEAVLYNAKKEHFCIIFKESRRPKNHNNFRFVLYGSDPDGENRVQFTDPDTRDGIESVTQQLAMGMFMVNFDPSNSKVALEADNYVPKNDLKLFKLAIQNAAEIVSGKPLEKPVTIKRFIP